MRPFKSPLFPVPQLLGTFPDPHRPADLDEAAESIPAQLAQGYTSICFNPSQFTDDVAEVPALCRRLVAGSAALT